jgi:hypothetical protein
MTASLQEAIKKASALPQEQQDTLAAILMEEIASEERWQQSFARSQDALSKLAAEALDEDAQGRTRDMDELL